MYIKEKALFIKIMPSTDYIFHMDRGRFTVMVDKSLISEQIILYEILHPILGIYTFVVKNFITHQQIFTHLWNTDGFDDYDFLQCLWGCLIGIGQFHPKNLDIDLNEEPLCFRDTADQVVKKLMQTILVEYGERIGR